MAAPSCAVAAVVAARPRDVRAAPEQVRRQADKNLGREFGNRQPGARDSVAPRSRCRAARRHPRNPPGFLKPLQRKRSPIGVPPLRRMKELVGQLPSERYPGAKRDRC